MKTNYFMIKEMPALERPREKMINHGTKRLSNAELIAILIHTGNKKQNAIELSHEIINNVGGLSGLTDITFEELTSIKGIGTAKACNILAALELNKRVSAFSIKKKMKITSPNDVCNIFMDELRYEKKEQFIIVLLNTKSEMISTEVISMGNLNSSIVHPREVYKFAIKKSAASVLFIHNHPSGDPRPSKNDKEITKRLTEVGNIIGINVLDHIIIGNNQHFSFKENNLI
ncbi:DNA repair protein RadC [Clostridiaceae bacterium HSG29]|nr:DNA repair protein RadC [Clostridiaceae bacterium HSG29]